MGLTEAELPTVAEALLLLARRIKYPANCVLLTEVNEDIGCETSRAALALKFDSLSSAVKFTAMYENWTLEQIVHEVY